MIFTKQLVVALAAIAPVTAVLADEWFEGGDRAIQITSTVSRDQVKREAIAQRAAPKGVWVADGVDQRPNFESQLSREAVAADFKSHRAEVAAFTGEDSGSAYITRGQSETGTGTKFAQRHP
jgi:hypothetical protein